ncbi:DUF4407 domain-containing protein [Mycolicibacterium celeriflavum]|uniref:Membrane protein n=1 Tax=Mycolicibacterium celeriflavum TaxID=1249101 RepID=A0A1X0BKM6_MYCCF|nr:DUF4407 domain-containing protein [Mycolicibacterium celeriflavum]MCV7240947.1 DUF4407 domain-containing protein [Mycolicibacterium celeriflavum]ORA42790.1 hypothetical protein BST21_22930 [Mycolicibacterium celeriflavum]BBY44189.1 membrane protein [Mycolicibacterium celeriflavum]
MSAHRSTEPDAAVTPIAAVFVWLGGAERRELARRDERSTLIIAGAVVLLVALLAWAVAVIAVAGSTSWPVVAVIAATSVAGLLVGAMSRAIASGAVRGRRNLAGRAAVAVGVGIVVGELAAMALFSGSIDRVLDERIARSAESSPAAAQAAVDLDRSRAARDALDDAVEQALQRRQEALVVARCEFNPRPDCPQTFITGVPGSGPGTQTADDFLADAQRQLDDALAEQELRAPALEAQVADDERALTQAREAAAVDGDRGLGARWVAMNEYTSADMGALTLRLLVDGFFVLLSLLPLILKLWRGETSQDRGIAADVKRDRAEVDADTAIAVKRAEVRAAIDNMWAEQQLTSARLAIEAQNRIDREQQRRRVMEAIDGPASARVERLSEPAVEDVYLPIAAEAEAASLVSAELPVAPEVRADEEGVAEIPNLPARDEHHEPAGRPLIPTIPDVTKAAARWIRPLVPPIIASAIDTTTRPLRGARQILEETEEIHFSLRRSRKVTFHSEEGDAVSGHSGASADAEGETGWSPAEDEDRNDRDYCQLDARVQHRSLARSEAQGELDRRGSYELSGPRGPRQLPPGR